jgi:hypothetical protein
MNFLHTFFFCILLLLLSSASAAPSAEPAAATVVQDGRHDFDFLLGDWQVQHRKLRRRLAGSDDWQEFDGTLSTRPVLDGGGSSGDNVFNQPDGRYHGVSLRTYDAASGLWASWWVDGRNPHGAVDPPIKGRFENGVGTFYADDTLDGKPIRVKVTWSRITPVSARWEQSWSADGGKTWEVNWTSDFRRVGATPAGTVAQPPGYTTARRGSAQDFTYFTGAWRTVQRRLKVRGSGSDDWEEFPANLCMTPYMDGHVSADEIHFPTKGWSGFTLRNFDKRTSQWAVYWISSSTGEMEPPVVGGFDGDRGEFYGEDEDNGKPVKVRYTWHKRDNDHARWEQAFSYDNRSWETNWTAEFVRGDAAQLCSAGRPRR